jgi:hypothetical protein
MYLRGVPSQGPVISGNPSASHGNPSASADEAIHQAIRAHRLMRPSIKQSERIG